MIAAVGRITAEAWLVRVGIALSPAVFRVGGGRMMSNIAVGSRQRRESAGGRGGFGFGRKGPA